MSGRYVLLAGLVVLLVGCRGPVLGLVQGEVRLDGKAVPEATVIFSPDDGPSSLGITDGQGQFELRFAQGKPGALVGRHRVTIETYRVAVRPDGTPYEVPETIPARYNVQSELRRDVRPGRQTFQFDLQTP